MSEEQLSKLLVTNSPVVEQCQHLDQHEQVHLSKITSRFRNLDISENNIDMEGGALRKSLFPGVAPFINFVPEGRVSEFISLSPKFLLISESITPL